MRTFFFLLLLSGGVLAAPDDDPESPKESPPAKVDWGNYTDHTRVAGEIEKLTEDGFTLKIVKSYTRGRPPKPVYEKVDLQYHESVQIRWPKLPPKLNETRKKVPYTPKELVALKLPRGAPGYAAAKADLQEGARVEVQLLRPKATRPDQLVTTDFKMKYVVILAPGSGEPEKK